MSIFYQDRAEHLQFYLSDNNICTPHLHKQAELFYVLEGHLSVTVDGKERILSPGEGALIFPNQLHSTDTDGTSRILLCIFDSDFCHSYARYFRHTHPENNFFVLDKTDVHSKIALMGLLRLTRDFERKAPVPPDILPCAEGYLTLLLSRLFAQLSLTDLPESEDLELEQRLLIYLDSHFTENLSLDILSRKFGVSRFTLSRIFSEKLHTTFPNYVNAKRLAYAADLLRSGNLSVTQIALDAGFGSSRSFFREFQKEYRTTPAKYRSSLTH